MYIAIVLKAHVCASDSRLCPVYVVFAIHAVLSQETTSYVYSYAITGVELETLAIV